MQNNQISLETAYDIYHREEPTLVTLFFYNFQMILSLKKQKGKRIENS